MMQFNKILNLILKNIKEKQVNLQSIHEISKIDPKLWEDWSNKVSSLDESTINQLNKSISDLLKLNEPGDFWQILILSRKLTDIQLSLPALNFEEQLEQRSIDVSEFSAKIIKFINEEIPKKIPEEKLVDYVSSWKIPKFPISGDYLKKHGYGSDQKLGKKLKSLEEKWIENNFVMDEKIVKNL